MIIKNSSILQPYRGRKLSLESLSENGFFILENNFSQEGLNTLSKLRNRLIDESKIQEKTLTNLRGFELGNLNINKCFVHKEIWNLMMDSKSLSKILESFGLKSIENFYDMGGNINFPESTPQAFHRDSNLKNKKLLLFIALEKITIQNGAQEVIADKHVEGATYFHMLKARIKNGSILLNMKCGDILLRYSTTWHRGRKNLSVSPRPVPLFSINLNVGDLSNRQFKINHLQNEISFSGNYAPKGKFKELIYSFIANKFHRIFHLFIYLIKLFRTQ